MSEPFSGAIRVTDYDAPNGWRWARPLSDTRPKPGERCPVCDRRVNKPRQPSSPDSRKVKAGELPVERAAAVEEGLDALQAFIGADDTSYPRGSLLEALVVLGGQEREALRDYFTKEEGHA